MSQDIAAQLTALWQGVLLGAAMGLLYDFFRVLRARIKLPFLARHWISFSGVRSLRPCSCGPSGSGAEWCACTVRFCALGVARFISGFSARGSCVWAGFALI